MCIYVCILAFHQEKINLDASVFLPDDFSQLKITCVALSQRISGARSIFWSGAKKNCRIWIGLLGCSMVNGRHILHQKMAH